MTFRFKGKAMRQKRLMVDSDIDLQIAAPFFAYMGGKRKLSKWIISSFPQSFSHYFEPFVGAGAVFWQVRKSDMAKGYTISDLAPLAANNYLTLRDDYTEFMKLTWHIARQHNYDYFQSAKIRLRRMLKAGDFNPETAALDIYLKKCSVHSSSHSPKSYGKKPYIIHEDLFLVCHKLLQGVNIYNRDFSDISPSRGDVVYCDPPYTGMREYYKAPKPWRTQDDDRLIRYAQQWDDNGVYVFLSGATKGYELSEHYLVKHLPDFEVKETIFTYRIGTQTDLQRPETKELLLYNMCDMGEAR